MVELVSYVLVEDDRWKQYPNPAGSDKLWQLFVTDILDKLDRKQLGMKGTDVQQQKYMQQEYMQSEWAKCVNSGHDVEYRYLANGTDGKL